MDYQALAQELISTLAYRKMPTEDNRRMSIGEQGILNYLHYVKDNAMPGEISREIGITTGRTAIALKKLEEKGMICRQPSQKDKRCVRVCITREGAESAEAIWREALEKTTRMLEELGEPDAREYVRILKRIVQMNG